MHENARKHEANTRSSSNRNMKGDDSFGPRQFTDRRNQRLVEGTLITNSRKGGEQQQGEPAFPCIFCKGSHFNDNTQHWMTLNSSCHYKVDVLYV